MRLVLRGNGFISCVTKFHKTVSSYQCSTVLLNSFWSHRVLGVVHLKFSCRAHSVHAPTRPTVQVAPTPRRHLSAPLEESPGRLTAQSWERLLSVPMDPSWRTAHSFPRWRTVLLWPMDVLSLQGWLLLFFHKLCRKLTLSRLNHTLRTTSCL